MLATTLAYLPKIPALLVAMKLMDGFGRRALLLSFIPAMGLCLAAMSAAVSGAIGSGAVAGTVALVATCLYGVVFVLSLGPVPNILTAELFPARVRSAAMALSLAAQFGANALVRTNVKPSANCCFSVTLRLVSSSHTQGLLPNHLNFVLPIVYLCTKFCGPCNLRRLVRGILVPSNNG